MIPRRRRPTPITAVVRFDQDEQRRRRRQHLGVVYAGEFDLTAEVAAICGPLARRVAHRPEPLAFRHYVAELTDAVHAATGTIVGWLAELDARRATEHLAAEPGKRAHAVRRYVDLAQRPTPPTLTDNALATGSWSAALATMTAPVGVQLADLLARAFPPGDDRLRGTVSRSDHLVTLLRETVDRAALSLARRLDWAESQPAPRPAAAADPAAELRELGVVIP